MSPQILNNSNNSSKAINRCHVSKQKKKKQKKKKKKTKKKKFSKTNIENFFKI